MILMWTLYNFWFVMGKDYDDVTLKNFATIAICDQVMGLGIYTSFVWASNDMILHFYEQINKEDDFRNMWANEKKPMFHNADSGILTTTYEQEETGSDDTSMLMDSSRLYKQSFASRFSLRSNSIVEGTEIRSVLAVMQSNQSRSTMQGRLSVEFFLSDADSNYSREKSFANAR